MCGIAGIVSLKQGAPPPTIDQLADMAAAIHHRGPDEFGVYRDARVGLAHARLSIIDLATGQQPLTSVSGRTVLVFNGEIFNYVELREELVALGHAFKTKSDTEVIVAAWEAWGEAAFDRFNGQFAIGLWDTKANVFVFARDRLGVRPLYIARHGDRLYFGSEVKALFAGDRTIPRALDPIGIDQTFTFWTVVPPRTPFAGVEELLPGHVRILDLSGDEPRSDVTKPFWTPRYPDPEDPSFGFRGNLDEATRAVSHALTEATRLRMVRADVPVGSYLSGGLDSSLVASMGLRAKGEQFSTFSLRFEDAEYDETEFQRLMVKRLGSEHHEVVVSRGDIARVFPDVIAHTERPILRTAPAPLYLLSKLVRSSGIKVVLTGEGADEMFAGYDIFREGKVRRFWAAEPKSKCRPLLLDRLYPYLARSPVSQRAMAIQFFGRDLDKAKLPGFAHGPRFQSAIALKRLFANDFRERLGDHDAQASLLGDLPPAFARWSDLAQDQYIEVRTLLSGYLLSSQGDRMLMAHSVEGRFPFLDREVVTLANSLPASHKLKVLDEKHVLKRAALEHVPQEILQRKKQPYRAPDALAFVGADVPAYVDEALSPEAIAKVGVFGEGASRLWQKVKGRTDGQFSNADNMAVVGVLSTQLLHQRLVAEDPARPAITLRTRIDRLAT